jgi:glutathione S-transferase
LPRSSDDAMAELILHQYEMSPFSEKLRRLLAWKGLAWRAVRAPAVMPKPDLTALTGGYRKIPVLQIANHVYCDTALIARVLEERSPAPTLYPTPIAESLAEWADSVFFDATVPLIMRPTRFDDLLKWLTKDELGKMADDRRDMRDNARRTSGSPKILKSRLGIFLARFDATLTDRAFLLGAEPSIADFAVYHSAWMLERVAPEQLAAYSHLQAWMQRIGAFPAPNIRAMSSEEALGICRASGADWQPSAAFADPLGFTLNQQVVVRASDYGRDPVQGALVSSTPSELVLERHDERAGTVYVHFPRIGFDVEAAAVSAAE